MNISKFTIFFLLYFTVSSTILCKTATLRIYSALIDYKAFFQDEDVSILSYNLIDPGILSNEVKVSGSMSIDGIYTTFTGQFTSPYSNKDNNSNGIYDFFEVGESFSMDLAGYASYSLAGYGDFTANLYANVQRIYGQHSFNLNETVTIQSSSINGINIGQTESISEKLNAVHALGTITYDENARTYTYYLGYHGTTGSASGSGTYSVNSDSSITLSEMSFPSIGDSSFASSFPALAKKTLSSSLTIPYVTEKKFYVMTEIENAPFYLVIEDDNDDNSDGKPDFIRSQSGEIQGLNLSGWSYHVWPWVYNSSDDNWLYYHRNGDDWIVWRNKTSTWLKFNPQTGYWLSN